MKIKLPNGKKKKLNTQLSLQKKTEIVEKLLNEWESFCYENWELDQVMNFLEGLANYLVWHKEEEDKNKHDKEVISVTKTEQMTGRRKAASLPFSSLNRIKKSLIGVEGSENGQR